MRFDCHKIVSYKNFEIELMFFDDMGTEPVTFVLRRLAGEGLEKYGKFVVNDGDSADGDELASIIRIWRDGYHQLMFLDEFIEKTLGK